MSTCPPRKPLNVNISKPDSGAHPTAGFCSRISNQDWLLFFRLFFNAFLSSLEYPSSSVHSVRGVVKVRGGGLHSSENEGSRGFVGHQTGPTVTMCPLTRLFARRVLQSKQRGGDCECATGVSHNHPPQDCLVDQLTNSPFSPVHLDHLLIVITWKFMGLLGFLLDLGQWH